LEKNLFVFNKGDAGVFCWNRPLHFLAGYSLSAAVINWRRGNGFATKEESFCELQRLAPFIRCHIIVASLAASSIPFLFVRDADCPGTVNTSTRLSTFIASKATLTENWPWRFMQPDYGAARLELGQLFSLLHSTGRGKGKTSCPKLCPDVWRLHRHQPSRGYWRHQTKTSFSRCGTKENCLDLIT